MHPSLWNRVNLDSSLCSPANWNPLFQLASLISGFLKATQLFSPNLLTSLRIECVEMRLLTIKHRPEFYCWMNSHDITLCLWWPRADVSRVLPHPPAFGSASTEAWQFSFWEWWQKSFLWKQEKYQKLIWYIIILNISNGYWVMGVYMHGYATNFKPLFLLPACISGQ